MSAILLASNPLTIHSSNALVNAPANRVLVAEPGLVMRASGSVATITFSNPGIIDTVGVVGRLQATDTIRVRCGSDAAMATGVVYDEVVAAWTGIPPLDYSISYIPLPSDINAAFCRIDVTRPNASQVELTRVLLGRRLEFDGIDGEADFTPISGTTVSSGPGWTHAVKARTRLSIKATVSNIKRAAVYTDWNPFINRVGLHEGFLFIPDTDSDAVQQEGGQMRMASDPKLSEVSGSRYRVELQLLQV